MPKSRPLMIAVLLLVLASQSVRAQDAVPLPEITVEVAREWCPIDDDELARDAMRRAGAQRMPPSSFDVISTTAQSVYRRIPIESVGVESVPANTASISRGSTRRGRDPWLRLMDDGIFARPLSMSSFDGRFESWEYAPLYADIAYYFFTPEFLDAHVFAFMGSDARQVGFCSSRRTGTFIDGFVTLGSGGEVRAVSWTYVTPDPDEQAGGRTEFFAGRDPFPKSGLYWRRLPMGDFQEWADSYAPWSANKGPG